MTFAPFFREQILQIFLATLLDYIYSLVKKMFYKKLKIPGKLQLKSCFSLISFSLILVCSSLILV